MAIQIPNVGTGNAADQTGDNEWLAMKKVADNFKDATNAASRLVGSANGNLPDVTRAFGVMGLGYGGRLCFLGDINLDTVPSNAVSQAAEGTTGIPCGFFYSNGDTTSTYKWGRKFFINVNYGANHGWRLGTDSNGANLSFQSASGTTWGDVVRIYHTGNATRDSNGFLKAASPIVRVFADKVEFNNDAQKQNIEYVKNGVGDYLIKNSSGLSNDGWYIETPKDANGNVLVAVVYKQLENGDISIKTYAKKFDEETGDIVPNLARPRDIPDTRWIDLRLNDIEKDMPPMPLDKSEA